MPHLDLDHHRLHYQWDDDPGPAPRPVLVLSNSIGTDLSQWQPALPFISEHFRLLRYDARGHGASTAVADAPCTMADLGGDVLALMDHLEIGAAHVCGVSLGGMTALWLAVHAPARVSKVVAAANAAHTESPAFWQARIDTVRAQGLEALADGVMQRFFGEAFRAEQAATVADFRQRFTATSVAGYLAGCEAIRDFDLRAELPRVAAPVLALAGRHDLASPPAQSQAIARAVPGGRYAELEAAHLLHVEAPAAFARVLTDFLIRESR